jgi:hypothetical protein
MAELVDLPSELFSRRAKIADEARETPTAANCIQYPQEFHNCVPVITAESLVLKKLPTIIIATQSEGYTAELFRKDVDLTRDYFRLDDSMMHTILLKPVIEGLDVLDSADATKQMNDVVERMNTATGGYYAEMHVTAQLPTGQTMHGKAERLICDQPLYTLRIVSLGVKTSNFMFEAMEYMLNHWTVPKKHVQFVTNGETRQQEFLNFWISASVNKLCEAVQFVDVSQYLSFGYYKKGKCQKLQKTWLSS